MLFGNHCACSLPYSAPNASVSFSEPVFVFISVELILTIVNHSKVVFKSFLYLDTGLSSQTIY